MFFLTCSFLKSNLINGTLDLGTNYSKQLEFVDLRNNEITGYKGANNHIPVMYVSILVTNQVLTFLMNHLCVLIDIYTGWQITKCAKMRLTS